MSIGHLTNITVEKKNVTKKSFSIKAILGITTGRVLDHGGYGPIHELMDHFFPGIMTLGSVAMAPVAKSFILQKYPFLGEVESMDANNWEEVLERELKKLPATLELEGPLEVTEEMRMKALTDFTQNMRSGKEEARK